MKPVEKLIDAGLNLLGIPFPEWVVGKKILEIEDDEVLRLEKLAIRMEVKTVIDKEGKQCEYTEYQLAEKDMSDQHSSWGFMTTEHQKTFINSDLPPAIKRHVRRHEERHIIDYANDAPDETRLQRCLWELRAEMYGLMKNPVDYAICKYTRDKDRIKDHIKKTLIQIFEPLLSVNTLT